MNARDHAAADVPFAVVLGNPKDEARQLAGRTLPGDPGLETAHGRIVEAPYDRLRRIDDQRQPQLGLGGRKSKVGGHDAHDPGSNTADLEDLADHVAPAAVPP